MELIIKETYDQLSLKAAEIVASVINNFVATPEHPKCTLGLPTGSTPLGMYKALIKMNQQGKVSFKNVITFNMDEYVGLDVNHPESYHSFMFNNFFNHIDIDKSNVHILNGNAPDLEKECNDYEKAIKEVGGIDLFVGGIGNDGHIAFNEPGSSLNSRTRCVKLTHDTIIANSRFFDFDLSKVPVRAVTVGIGTVTDAQRVMILVNGHAKARALHHAVEGGVSQMWPVTALQLHNHSTIIASEDACDELKVGTFRYYLDLNS
ncbi:MAG: glucosamine-6-phosphate deaminase [Muribaculaceae bacterium]|nr:glucosamine-6-phosphate deaminase [Muribaculaceae bacterium]